MDRAVGVENQVLIASRMRMGTPVITDGVGPPQIVALPSTGDGGELARSSAAAICCGHRWWRAVAVCLECKREQRYKGHMPSDVDGDLKLDARAAKLISRVEVSGGYA